MNPKPYKMEMEFNGQKLTSVVVSQEQFDEIMDKLEDAFSGHSESLHTCRDAGHIPMISRGSKTGLVFEMLEIGTELMSIIVRGKGPELVKDLLGGD